MRPPVSSVFLERQNYRRRRLIDLIKILPLIGMMLWLVPLLWPIDGKERVSSADAMIYIFAIWFVLVIAKSIAARFLFRASDSDHRDLKRGENGQP
jgi:hypothetical protein